MAPRPVLLDLVFALTLSCILGAGCAAAKPIVVAAEPICEVVLRASVPTAEPLCATAEEIALAILALTQRKSLKLGEHASPPSQDEIYREVLQRRSDAGAPK